MLPRTVEWPNAHHPLEGGDLLSRCRAGQPPAGHMRTDRQDKLVISHSGILSDAVPFVDAAAHSTVT
jgi:hypothetical protein